MDALQYQYKRKLQGYAQRRNIDSPLYASQREGLPHALCFKATVTVDGRSFESPSYYNTLKEAENASAKVALKSLSLDGFQENDSSIYKNLLQQLAQNEGFILPTYKTISTGESHKPTFFSTVEVEEEIFHGKGGPSKKQAELNAAEVAYTAFMERKLSRSGSFTSPTFSEDEALEFNPIRDSLAIVDPQQSLKHGGPLVLPLTVGCEDRAKENKAKNLLVSVKTSSQDSISSPGIPDMDKTTGNRKSSCSLESLPSSPNEGQSSSATMVPPNLSTLSIADSNRRTTMGTSYLLCNRVRVYKSIPDMAFPKGTVVLPISDDKWVAVSLEFPNEKDN
ncbi:hypothetical protein F0562_022418 [Nyssa sinensis]|uniref:DRBM domain-containing protein n=1 Tax=Nyssa sinensis TaxID=561372 RepID=A0A5J5BNW5_9ASTE|nr:hypothetical protein F0562_022418 [Nyssa sinensis]